MDTLLYVGLSQQTGLKRRLDVIANNVANMNTVAFRREDMMFRRYLADFDGEAVTRPNHRIDYVLDYGISRVIEQGAITPTGNSLDLALDGQGYFVVETPAGDTRYTRAGHFTLNADGELSTMQGSLVLNANGNPIRFAPETRDITISESGEITTETGFVARLDLVDFADPNLLEHEGNNQFSTEQEPIEPENLQVRQEALEGSNVNPIKEMTKLINVTRAYQSTERTLDRYQDLRSRAIDDIAEVV